MNSIVITWAAIWIATAHYYYQDKPELKGSAAIGSTICFIAMAALTIKELIK